MDYFSDCELFEISCYKDVAFKYVLFYLSHENLISSVTSLTVILVSMIIIVITAYRFRRKLKTKVETVTAKVMGTRPRFRKRDKVMFYGRKMLRKVQMLSGQPGSRPRIKKRQLVLKLARKILPLKREQPLTLKVMEPSQAFLEEAISEQAEQRLPPDVMYMLKSIRVFGSFEKPLFLELCKHIETLHISCGSLLFSIGEPDDSIYVVQSGKLVVYVTENDGSELVLKEVAAGENITSLLSVMDALTGCIAPYKSVSARALANCVVLRLRVEAFRSLLEKNPESLVRVAQIIMVRLQRVTFTALHNYLGLTKQLIKSSSTMTRRNTVSPKSSPSKASSRRPSQVSYKPFNDIRNADFSSAFNDIDSSASQINTEENVQSATNESDQVESKKPRKRKASFYFPPEQGPIPPDEEDLHALAVQGFVHQLGLEDDSYVKDYVTVKELPANTYMIREETVEDVALLYVIAGSLSVSQKTADKKEENFLFIVHSGEIMGALAVLSGEPSLFTIRTRHFTQVGILSKKNTYDILSQKPLAVLHLAQSVIKRLSSFVRQIDFALDWINVESGRAIYRQDDISDSTYILLSGRLRSVLKRPNGKKELVGEYGRGDLVGIVEVLTSTRRSTTVMAVRNSELAKLPEGLLNAIKIKFPEVVTRFIHLLGHRILGSLQKRIPYASDKALTMDSRPSGSNFATVAILGVNDDVPLTAFTLELNHALTAIGPTLRLTSEIIKKTLGPTALLSANEYRLCSWLGQQEDQHKVVLYQCDSYFSPWSQRCIRQADCIIIVALADSEPTVGEMEKELEHFAVRTQKELVLLHRDDRIKPRNTVEWLNMRSWCSSHYHIRCPKRMFTKKSPMRLADVYNKLFINPPNIHSDFARLARFLTGTSFGLVLGGGGARGAAHVGTIKALREAGIPIDMVGGVSIGAFMGALWCQESDVTTMTQKAREWSYKMNSYWHQILDLTYPATAMFTGAGFNRTIKEVFGERQIEDLWLPYFTVTTDITDSNMRVHTHGSLWRYVRSSMSLSGYMPPMCDPLDGHLLLDGGYVNNLPADVMRDMGAETIIAIDVGSQDDIDLTNYGDTLSGWWLLWKKWNPWSSPVKVPSLQEIQSRLAYVSCVKQLDQIKRSDYCTYIRPPIDKYKTLAFGSFDEIMEVGYNHGKALFPSMKMGHKSLHNLLQNEIKKECEQRRTLRNASFTDLAEMVCKIKKPLYKSYEVSDEEDDLYDRDVGGYTSEPEPSLLGDTDKEEDAEDYASSQHDNVGSLSDVEYSTEREL
ncbi:neuropathy target esterase sws [Trichonephila inaurata madagascariensis]|uniref:Neuropathy target esterase sws n=1 Tax=Trichonephila inaurata madagascariensis TaxID=2747483 RepID=A0A8X6XUD7_9ARAC|nr:neuropathy target esterase sws [Trichonephila inaurata madagascariensis]